MAALGKSFIHCFTWPQLHAGSGRVHGVPVGGWFQALGGRDGDWIEQAQSCLKLRCRGFLGGK